MGQGCLLSLCICLPVCGNHCVTSVSLVLDVSFLCVILTSKENREGKRPSVVRGGRGGRGTQPVGGRESKGGRKQPSPWHRGDTRSLNSRKRKPTHSFRGGCAGALWGKAAEVSPCPGRSSGMSLCRTCTEQSRTRRDSDRLDLADGETESQNSSVTLSQATPNITPSLRITMY